jgi:hypothetical protein
MPSEINSAIPQRPISRASPGNLSFARMPTLTLKPSLQFILNSRFHCLASPRLTLDAFSSPAPLALHAPPRTCAEPVSTSRTGHSSDQQAPQSLQSPPWTASGRNGRNDRLTTCRNGHSHGYGDTAVSFSESIIFVSAVIPCDLGDSQPVSLSTDHRSRLYRQCLVGKRRRVL